MGLWFNVIYFVSDDNRIDGMDNAIDSSIVLVQFLLEFYQNFTATANPLVIPADFSRHRTHSLNLPRRGFSWNIRGILAFSFFLFPEKIKFLSVPLPF